MEADKPWQFLAAWAGICGREDGRKSDKIPLDARHEWVNDNIEIFLSYIKEPKVNQGWMEADKPWQFLAACNELNNLIQWQQQNIDRINKGEVGLFDYESGIEVFIDGSNNGSQHLAALTKDEVTAPHVNLVQSEYPGDIYAYVAESVWKRIEEEVNSLDIQERIACEQIIQELTKFKLDIKSLSVKSEQRRVLVDQLVLLRKANEKLIAKAAPVFWNKIVDLKDRRKIIKRNVMTLPL
jgi:DNA-directed RNA polymerase